MTAAMTKAEFLNEIDLLLELPPGTTKGTERLDELAGWDSLAVIGFIAMVDGKFGTVLSTTRLQECQTVADLMDLVKDKVTA